jgi:dinuclear metal center YbgI/SA1388 family protein
MAGRDAIVEFCNQLLDIERYPDGLPIGLQVPGAEDVQTLVTGVSASLELFGRAAELGAQMVLVHHGMFYGSGPRPPIDAREKARLKALFDADLSLVAYHLALDAHAEVGNNALLCDLLGAGELERFGGIGYLATFDPPVTLDDLLDTVRAEIKPDPLVFAAGPERIGRIAVISGSAAGYVEAAADAGADCFLTGEPKEQVMNEAREAGIHFVAAGHYATEVFGVRALGDVLAERFGIDHRFVDLPNPV